jgi:L-lysine 2,3-aminomutase
MVVHCNHPQEIDDQVRACFAQIRQHHLTLLNQSVILKGINDNSRILATLSEQLFALGVMPYYLHMLDPVKGAGHFDVDLTQVKKVYAELLGLLPGYLVPKLVKEVPHRASKTPVAPF